MIYDIFQVVVCCICDKEDVSCKVCCITSFVMFGYTANFNNGGKPLKLETGEVWNMKQMFQGARIFNQEVDICLVMLTKTTPSHHLF